MIATEFKRGAFDENKTRIYVYRKDEQLFWYDAYYVPGKGDRIFWLEEERDVKVKYALFFNSNPYVAEVYVK